MRAREYNNRQGLPLDWSTLHKALRDETRKKIILQLHTAGTLAYTDLMNRLDITNTGSLNYHLKKLNNLIEKNEQGAYTLTEKGTAAAELLEKLPSQIPSSRALRASDTLLIGFLGFLLILLPAYAEVFATSATLGFLLAGVLLFSLYPLFVPSSLMWLLTIRRINSHDLYDLVKPPVTAAGMFYLLQLLLFIIPNLLAASQLQPPTTTTTTHTLFISFPSYVFLPWTPLLGLLIIEGVYRLRNH